MAEQDWDPTQPLADKEDEEDVQRKANAIARRDFLIEEAKAKIKKTKKKGVLDI
jgi:uncharacterized protein YjgD (DUF1641 family)